MRVDGFMAAVVVMANMGQVYRVGNPGHLVDITQKTAQIQVVANTVTVTFKMGDVNRIEAHQRGP